MISRRDFVANVAATTAAVTIVPRHVLGKGHVAPSDRLNIAGVGVGGMGRTNLLNLGLDNNLVALCDVNWGYAGPQWSSDAFATALKREEERLFKTDLTPESRRNSEHRVASLKRIATEDLGKQKRYSDYRLMLEEQKDIDAIVVATPDHMHAPIAMAALDAGKHVYVQKPLCWSVDEARKLSRKARQTPKAVTQMGNQGHSWDGGRKLVEWVQSGAIGDVTEAHVWTNRPLSYWPQGIPRPEPKRISTNMRWNMNGVMARLANAMGIYSKPDELDWDLFLGCGPARDYHPVYHPFNWRGWIDWGGGALSDMGAHLIDFPYWALDLGYPTSIETVSTPFDGECYPIASKTYYEFPARGNKPAVKLTWYDGGMFPATPPEFADGEKLNGEGGVIMVGSKGKAMCNTYGLEPRLLPASLQKSVGDPPRTLERITTSHEVNWSNACKGVGKASTPIEYAARLTEVMLLGVVALRAGEKLHYDGANMEFTNSKKANDFLKREYRRGFSL